MNDAGDHSAGFLRSSLSLGWKVPFVRRDGTQAAMPCFLWSEFNGALPRIIDVERDPPRDMLFAVFRYAGGAGVWVVFSPDPSELFEFLDLMTQQGVEWTKVDVIRQQAWTGRPAIEI
jgi:hypothetical protein